MSNAQTKFTYTKEIAALAVADMIQACINTDTAFIMNHKPHNQTITITAKRNYDKFKVLFPKAEIKSDIHSNLYCELTFTYA